MGTYIAMWSGPRNISTALMRSFGSRGDTTVVDEPLYAHYLAETGLDHPGRDEILRRHERDWRKVVETLTEPLAAEDSIFYQKHMAHHLLEDVQVEWLASFRQAFLIRDPRAMLASLDKVLTTTPRLVDTGLPQQVRLFEEVSARTGIPAPVVDSTELLKSPEAVLRELCERMGIDFDPAMLRWDAGPRDTDGCWGPIWYENTYRSTGFEPYGQREATLRPELEAVLEEALPLYESLHQHRIEA